MLYAYVCDICGKHEDRIRVVADRDKPVVCPNLHRLSGDRREEEAGRHELVLATMRREISTPTVHFKGAGWTRTPSIMNDPIAAGHPGQRSNWGHESLGDYGDPNVSTPYKTVIGGDPVEGLASNATVGEDA